MNYEDCITDEDCGRVHHRNITRHKAQLIEIEDEDAGHSFHGNQYTGNVGGHMNVYGNVDISKGVPAGLVHFPGKRLTTTAKSRGIEHAVAVTGFAGVSPHFLN